MATVYITFKIMQSSPDVDLSKVLEKVKEMVAEVGNFASSEEEPVAFGLKALNVTFSMDESKGATDDMEAAIESLDEVQSVQVTDVRRAIG